MHASGHIHADIATGIATVQDDMVKQSGEDRIAFGDDQKDVRCSVGGLYLCRNSRLSASDDSSRLRILSLGIMIFEMLAEKTIRGRQDINRLDRSRDSRALQQQPGELLDYD